MCASCFRSLLLVFVAAVWCVLRGGIGLFVVCRLLFLLLLFVDRCLLLVVNGVLLSCDVCCPLDVFDVC